MSKAHIPRLYLPVVLSENLIVPLSLAQSHHLQHVLRRSPGSDLQAFDGKTGEWRGVLMLSAAKTFSLQVLEQIKPFSPLPDLDYWCVPIKQERMDFMIPKAVELGCGKIRLVETEYMQNRKYSLERVHRLVVEAAQQCGSLALPEVFPSLPLEKALDSLETTRALLWCDERTCTQTKTLPLLEMLRNVPRGPLAVLVGPEGGFSERECQMLRTSQKVYPLCLGPKILRSETAALAILTLAQTVLGDW